MQTTATEGQTQGEFSREDAVSLCGEVGGQFYDYIHALSPSGVIAFNQFMQLVREALSGPQELTLDEAFKVAERKMGAPLEEVLAA